MYVRIYIYIYIHSFPLSRTRTSHSDSPSFSHVLSLPSLLSALSSTINKQGTPSGQYREHASTHLCLLQ